MNAAAPLLAILGRFDGADALLGAIRAAKAAGVGDLDAYTPFAIEGLAEALGRPPSRIRPVMLVAGLIGAAIGFGTQYWSSVSLYPINEGGRPYASLPSFVPITFECAVGFAALAGFAAFLYAARLTRVHAPLFATPGFERASADGFFLSVGAAGPRFEADHARALLASWGAMSVTDVTP